MGKVVGAGVELTLVNELLSGANATLGDLNTELWTQINNGEAKAELRELIAPGGVLLTENTVEMQTILTGWQDEATLARQLATLTVSNPCGNIKALNYRQGYFSDVFLSEDFRTDLQSYLDAAINMGAYQNAREKWLSDDGKIIVTTLDDNLTMDAYDGIITLREAINYADWYSANNRYYYYEQTTNSRQVVYYNGVGGTYSQSVSTGNFYADERLKINRCVITFADDLAGGTIHLVSDLNLTGYTGNVNSDQTFYAGTIVWYYYIDAAPLAVNGGITIDASDCGFAFAVRGAKHATNDWVSVTYAEFEGVTITGAQNAGVFVDEYSIAEMRNCLIYRNRNGVYVEDDATMSKYYGIAYLYNVTIANSINDGIMNYGKFFIYNSILSLNGNYDVFSYPLNNSGNTPPPSYRTIDMYNSLYGDYNWGIYYFNDANRGNIYVIDALFVDEANDDYHLTTYSLGLNGASGDFLAKNRPSHADAQTDLDGKVRTQCGNVDMGAYENAYIYDVPSTVVTTNEDIVDPTDGLISIREAIAYAEQYQYTYTTHVTPVLIGNTVTFDSSLDGTTITLTGTPLTLVNDITIDARSLKNGIIIDADRRSGVFHIDIANTKYENDITAGKLNVNLYGINMTGGYTTDGGAVYIASGNVLIQDCDIYGNEATGHGGAIYIYRDELTLKGVNIGGNIAAHYGGVVSNQGRVLMEDTYIAENKAKVVGSDYDFYYYTISNANGYGSKTSVFGKTRNLNLTGHGENGDTNWIAYKDDNRCDNFEPDSVFAGSWDENNNWVGTLDRTFVAPAAPTAAALPVDLFADEDQLNDILDDIL